MPLAGTPVRSKSIRLAACSVGLRRSEIDGYFDVARSLWCAVSWNLDRKFDHAIGGHSRTIEINMIGCLSGRATSLGDRRLL